MKTNHILILLAVWFFTACPANRPAADSPSAALKRYVEASQKQDIEGMKNLLSRESLELIERAAKARGLTIEDLLRTEAAVNIKNAPETRNEKIEGETGSVEVKNETTGEYDMTLPFVREEGSWKIARDKYIEQSR